MITIYMFPGLGADETIFRRLQLPGYEIVHIKWIKPLNREPLPDYAKRLLYQIKKDTTPVLLGLSFGGMVAQEVAKLVNPAAVFVVSSIKGDWERPLQLDLAAKYKPQRFLPSLLAIRFDFWYRWAFGPTTRMEKAFIKSMALRIHPDFTDWAADTAINWRNRVHVPNVIHIHGDADSLFPIKLIKDAIVVKGGSHFMVYNKAEEVGNIILDKLAELNQQLAQAS